MEFWMLVLKVWILIMIEKLDKNAFLFRFVKFWLEIWNFYLNVDKLLTLGLFGLTYLLTSIVDSLIWKQYDFLLSFVVKITYM